MNNVSFSGKFSINTNQFKRLTLSKKAQLCKHEDKLFQTYCKKGSYLAKNGDEFIFNIKDDKENAFLKLMNKIGLYVRKVTEE